VLLAEQSAKIEETLWIALRMFEERKNLLATMAQGKRDAQSRMAAERARESMIHIERIRSMLRAADKERAPDGTNDQRPRTKSKRERRSSR
jgi:two-component system chemotaxis response regulator CheB